VSILIVLLMMAMTAQVGYRESEGEEQPAPVCLKVSSFRHLADRCNER